MAVGRAEPGRAGSAARTHSEWGRSPWPAGKGPLRPNRSRLTAIKKTVVRFDHGRMGRRYDVAEAGFGPPAPGNRGSPANRGPANRDRAREPGPVRGFGPANRPANRGAGGGVRGPEPGSRAGSLRGRSRCGSEAAPPDCRRRAATRVRGTPAGAGVPAGRSRGRGHRMEAAQQ
jgi:hypothetical protein